MPKKPMAVERGCQRVERCAVYTRKSTEEGLDQAFNSLDAQREACEAYILSQRHEGWTLVKDSYDDGGFSGGNMGRPGLKRLLADIEAGKVWRRGPLLSSELSRLASQDCMTEIDLARMARNRGLSGLAAEAANFAGDFRNEWWCPGEDSNLHGLAATGT